MLPLPCQAVPGGWEESGTDGLGEEGHEQHAGTPGMGFQIPIWTCGSCWSYLCQVRLREGQEQRFVFYVRGVLRFLIVLRWSHNYLRQSCTATPTTRLQIAYRSLKGSVDSPFLVFPWHDWLCTLQRRGPAARARPRGCDGARGFLAGLQAFVHGVPQVPCLHYPVQLPIQKPPASLLCKITRH